MKLFFRDRCRSSRPVRGNYPPRRRNGINRDHADGELWLQIRIEKLDRVRFTQPLIDRSVNESDAEAQAYHLLLPAGAVRLERRQSSIR